MNKQGKGLLIVLIILGILIVILLTYVGFNLTGHTIIVEEKDRTQDFTDSYIDRLSELYNNYVSDLRDCSVSILNTISEKCENRAREYNSLGSKTEWRGNIQNSLGTFTREEFNTYVNTYAVQSIETKIERKLDCMGDCVSILNTISIRCINNCDIAFLNS